VRSEHRLAHIIRIITALLVPAYSKQLVYLSRFGKNNNNNHQT
jgi:hypothetical protein